MHLAGEKTARTMPLHSLAVRQQLNYEVRNFMKTIRASKADINAIVIINLIVQELHSEAHPIIFKKDVEKIQLQAFFEKILEKSNHIIFLSYMSESPVGYMWAQVRNSSDSPHIYAQKSVYIHQLGVVKKYRRKGVASNLVDRAKELANEVYADFIQLDTWAFNDVAQQFLKTRDSKHSTLECGAAINRDAEQGYFSRRKKPRGWIAALCIK
jgi:ribosomal protein S18 acetylase RimI-like enzyme